MFSRRWMLGIILLWLVIAINLAAFYALQSWLPSILTRLDYDLGTVVAATTLTTVGGIAAAGALIQPLPSAWTGRPVPAASSSR